MAYLGLQWPAFKTEAARGLAKALGLQYNLHRGHA